mmetsp:Transcript_11658/g.27322  ORF Transcript_11658/g.27322 Transcript_11658/m.27322 type:complete len:337 (-) Transcript_11658:419-1429(-)
MHTLQLSSGNGQITRFRRTQCQTERIKLRIQLVDVHVLSDIGVGDEFDSFLPQQIDATVHGLLLQLHVGDSVHEQSSDAIGALKDGHLVSHLVQLVGAGQSGRSRSHHRHGHAAAFLRDAGGDFSVPKGPVDDRVFDVFDGHGIVHEPGHTGSLAGSGADPSREFGKVVGAVQALNGLVPGVLKHQIVPLRDQIVHRASRVGLAEGGPAIHAAGRLDLSFQGGVGHVDVPVRNGVDFFPILQAFQGGTVGFWIPFVVDKSPELFEVLQGAIPALYFDFVEIFYVGMATVRGDGSTGRGVVDLDLGALGTDCSSQESRGTRSDVSRQHGGGLYRTVP